MTTDEGGSKVPGGRLLSRNLRGALRKGARVVERETIRLRSFGLRARGFTAKAAKLWATEELAAKKSAEYSRGEISSALKHGYQPGTVRRFGPRALTEVGVSEKDYWFVHPMNGKYSKWVRDRVSTLAVFHPFWRSIEPVDFHILFREAGLIFIPMSNRAKQFAPTYSGLVRYLGSVGPQRLTGSPWQSPVSSVVAAEGDHLTVDGERVPESELWPLLNRLDAGNSFVVIPPSKQDDAPKLQVLMANPEGNNPRILEAQTTGPEPKRVALTSQDPVGALLLDMCRFAPQLEFVQFTLTREPHTEDWVITGVSPAPDYPTDFPFAPETAAFLRERITQKQQEHADIKTRGRKAAKNSKLKARRLFGQVAYPEGLVPYQSVRWLGDMFRDFSSHNSVPLRDKLWAYRNGLLSYRLPQYGITRDNREDFISDLEYRWLRHLNSQYKYWLEDKISIKYVAADFNDLFPKYYYQTSGAGQQVRIVPMMDLPAEYGDTFQDILRLVQDVGVVALKPEDGSHGEGFYRLEYTDGQYLLNGQPATEDAIQRTLTESNNRYLVTEFIQMHPDLARIYPDSVNTLRMIVFKQDGLTPQIGNAYLRIGSSKSGFIDNTAAGGMMAEVEVGTGWFGNGQVLQDGQVTDHPHHPDTGELIEGYLPGWEEVKQQVLDIAKSLPQLEYLGFDVAITEDGIKIPEINRFPDYPRINRLTPETTEYLLSRVKQKKHRLGHDEHPPRNLVPFPKRDGNLK